MDVQITGKGIDLGEALQEHVRDNMSAGVPGILNIIRISNTAGNNFSV